MEKEKLDDNIEAEKTSEKSDEFSENNFLEINYSGISPKLEFDNLEDFLSFSKMYVYYNYKSLYISEFLLNYNIDLQYYNKFIFKNINYIYNFNFKCSKHTNCQNRNLEILRKEMKEKICAFSDQLFLIEEYISDNYEQIKSCLVLQNYLIDDYVFSYGNKELLQLMHKINISLMPLLKEKCGYSIEAEIIRFIYLENIINGKINCSRIQFSYKGLVIDPSFLELFSQNTPKELELFDLNISDEEILNVKAFLNTYSKKEESEGNINHEVMEKDRKIQESTEEDLEDIKNEDICETDNELDTISREIMSEIDENLDNSSKEGILRIIEIISKVDNQITNGVSPVSSLNFDTSINNKLQNSIFKAIGSYLLNLNNSPSFRSKKAKK